MTRLLYRCTFGSDGMLGRSPFGYLVVIVWLLVACEGKKPEIIVPNYLGVSPYTVSLHIGQDTTVTVSGGSPPYTITRAPKSNIASAVLDSAHVLIRAVGMGSDHVTIGDIENRTVDVTITVSAFY